MLRPDHKDSFGMDTSVLPGARYTYQCKEQEQGREDEGRECIGHHCGGPLLRLSEQVLTREDTARSVRLCPSHLGLQANNCGEEILPRGQAFD